MLAIRDYEQAPYLVLATRNGLVKKTRLGDYNSPRQAGVIAINFREDDDELIGAELVNAEDDILLVSRKGQAIRFRADDSAAAADGPGDVGRRRDEVPRRRLAAVDVGDPGRPGRGRGRRRAERGDEDTADVEASAEEVGEVKAQYVFTMTDGGFAKRSRISEYRLQSRGGLGIKAMSLANEDRGGLVGAFIVVDGDEILSITAGGQVVRSPINDEFRATGRSTMGVKFVTPKRGDSVAVVARSVEARGRGRRGRRGRRVGGDAPSRCDNRADSRMRRNQEPTRPSRPTSETARSETDDRRSGRARHSTDGRRPRPAAERRR